VCTVCAAALLWCLVDLDVLHDEVTGIETLGIGVGLSVLEETEEELGRLDGPAGAGDTESLAYESISPSVQVPQNNSLQQNSLATKEGNKNNVPWAARPVPPAYLLMATASLCSWTFSRNFTARSSFQPLMAWAVSRVFLKDTRRYAPRARADFAGWISVAAYRTCRGRWSAMFVIISQLPIRLCISLAIVFPLSPPAMELGFVESGRVACGIEKALEIEGSRVRNGMGLPSCRRWAMGRYWWFLDSRRRLLTRKFWLLGFVGCARVE
jgi:hypothetical protein